MNFIAYKIIFKQKNRTFKKNLFRLRTIVKWNFKEKWILKKKLLKISGMNWSNLIKSK